MVVCRVVSLINDKIKLHVKNIEGHTNAIREHEIDGDCTGSGSGADTSRLKMVNEANT